MSALMAAVRCLTILEARPILRRRRITTERQIGKVIATTRASFHWTVNIMIIAPMTVRMEVTRSSGPWWASSVISNRSEVRRLIIWPVRLRS